MGQPTGEEELKMVSFCQIYGYMPAICRRTFPEIHRYIKDSPFYNTHQFGLRMPAFLEMEPADNTVGGLALVVLDESDPSDCLFELFFVE